MGFVGQFKLLLSVFLFCLKIQLSCMCPVDYHLFICLQLPKVDYCHLLSFFFFTVCLCFCHFTNPFTIILRGFKEGAECGVRKFLNPKVPIGTFTNISAVISLHITYSKRAIR